MDYCPRAPRYLAVGTESGEVDLFDLLAVGMGSGVHRRNERRKVWCCDTWDTSGDGESSEP